MVQEFALSPIHIWIGGFQVGTGLLDAAAARSGKGDDQLVAGKFGTAENDDHMSAVASPNPMHPRQMRDTLRSELPSLIYCIVLSDFGEYFCHRFGVEGPHGGQRHVERTQDCESRL